MHPDELDDLIRRSDDHVGAEPDENRPDVWFDHDAPPPGLVLVGEDGSVAGYIYQGPMTDVVVDSLVCSECGTIGNADDLAFLGEPCPRSWDEDEPCSGIMLAYSNEIEPVAGSTLSWRRVGGEPIFHLSTNPGGYTISAATMLAHAILSEVEIALWGGQ